MKINEIQLVNIGPYRGNNTFDFRTDTTNNVILVGGENGAGKTTLLNAIKLGLFGSYAFGFKTENNDYYRRVQNMLNTEAKRVNENNFQIKLDFTFVEDYEKTDYTLYRVWTFNNHSVKESFDIISNGKHFTSYEREIFHSKLKEIMPPQLLDLCLFDGEEISRIVNEDLLSDYLQNLSKVVFNLDLFEGLEHDLETYSAQNLDKQKMESNEQELHQLNQKEKDIKNEINILTTQLDSYKTEKQKCLDEYKIEKQTFDTNGGLIKAERENILQQINELEHQRKQNGDKIKDFVTSLLPFVLCKELIKDTKKQLANEESLHLFEQLNSKLSNENLTDILNSLSIPENNLDILKTKILDIVQPDQDLILIHDASFSESSLIENINIKVDKYYPEETTDLIHDNKNKLNQLSKLKSTLKVNDTTNEFSEIINNMENLQQSIYKLDINITKSEEQLAELMDSYNNVVKSIDKIYHTLKNIKKTKSSFLESQKIITLSKHFRQVQLKKKLQEVQIEATNLLRKMFRKQNYISSVLIDENTYDIQLLDANKEFIEKATLSAGEKQILLISLIWAIFKSSGREVPFIFDTLLGRLDKTHKSAVLHHFIPNCGEQTIILSTDSEIDAEHYDILKSYISKEYMLDFNVKDQRTTILNQYFPFTQIGERL